jgi:hypothetical protein
VRVIETQIIEKVEGESDRVEIFLHSCRDTVEGSTRQDVDERS